MTYTLGKDLLVFCSENSSEDLCGGSASQLEVKSERNALVKVSSLKRIAQLPKGMLNGLVGVANQALIFSTKMQCLDWQLEFCFFGSSQRRKKYKKSIVTCI